MKRNGRDWVFIVGERREIERDEGGERERERGAMMVTWGNMGPNHGGLGNCMLLSFDVSAHPLSRILGVKLFSGSPVLTGFK